VSERPVHYRVSYVVKTLCGRLSRRGVRDTGREQYVTCPECKRRLAEGASKPRKLCPWLLARNHDEATCPRCAELRAGASS
jgi:uncharacterized protein with PIN domain